MNWAPFGKLGKTHGLKGELKLHPFFPDTDLYQAECPVWLADEESAGQSSEYCVESIRGASPIIKLKGCDSLEEAKALVGCTLFVLRENFKKLPPGKYYWFEIEGLEAYDETGKFYGCVTEVIETGSNDVYVVKDGNKELLLPAIDWVIKSVDLEQNKLVFHVVEGLLEETAV